MNENALINILQNIEKRLSSLERNLNELSKRTAHSSHLDIKNVQTLNLDKLSYHLDHIDVKELSGTLNIGNTFPPQKSQYQSGGKKNKKTSSKSQYYGVKNKEEESSEISVKINGKSVPYRLINKHETSQPDKTSDKTPDKTLSSTFTIGDINIGTIEDASVVNFGNNFPTDFRSHKKVDQGFGNILGNQNDIHDIQSQLEEKDVMEVYNESQEKQPHEWLGKMEEEQKKEKDAAKLDEDEEDES